MEFNMNGPGVFGGFPTLAIVIMVVTAIIHIIFAVAVYIDGKENGTRLVWPSIWALVVLFGGPIIAAAYWVVCRLTTEQFGEVDSAALATELDQRIAARRSKLAQKRQQGQGHRTNQ